MTGKILVSEVQVRENPQSSSKTKFYRPVVIYEYSADGKTYRSKRLGSFLAYGNNRNFADDTTAQFAVDSHPRVYHHPRFPGVSALIPGMQQPAIHLVLLFTGTILSVASGLALFSDNPMLLLDWVFRFIEQCYITHALRATVKHFKWVARLN